MQGTPTIGRTLSLQTIVTGGIAVVWGAVVLWSLAIGAQVLFSQRIYEMAYVRLDGKPVIYRHGGGGHTGPQILTLEREVLPENNEYLLYGSYLQPAAQLRSMPLTAESWSARITAANDGRTPAAYWYLVHNGEVDGRAYGVGYNSVTKRRIGYFSRKGFASELPAEADWFQVAGGTGLAAATPQLYPFEPGGSDATTIFLLADGKVWSIDTQIREVKAIADAPRATSIGNAWVTLEKLPEKKPGMPSLPAQYLTRQKMALLEEGRLTLIDHASGEQKSFALPATLERATLSPYELHDGSLLVLSRRDTGERSETRLVRVGANGEVLQDRDIELAQGNSFQDVAGAMAWSSLAAAPLLLVQLVQTMVVPWMMSMHGVSDSYREAMAHYLGTAWPVLVLMLLLSVFLAVVTYRRQRRFGQPWGAAWGVFVFLLGVPGWIAYRFHRTWPVLEACPACQQASPRDQERCLDCGAVFPGPGLRGTEVFS